MKTINYLLIFAFCWLNISVSFAQGFTFDKEAYEDREIVENLRGPIPSSLSLKRFTPIIYPQETSNCVAQSFANALTILFAKESGANTKENITVLRPSPFFIYYLNKDRSDIRCSEGLDAEKTAVNLLRYGVVPLISVEYPNYYPFTDRILCNTYPPVYEVDLKSAMNTRPSNIYRISNLLDIKIALANGMPVVIGMMVPESFAACRSDVWSPRSTDNIRNTYGHAMTVVGYNDNNYYGGSFEVMNSWGENWGNNGYTNIRYKDAANWIVAGWAVERQTGNRYRYDGAFRSKEEGLTPSTGMIQIFNEALQDTLMVNPFFQRTDLKELFQDIE